jgi:putative FmdB family regulatory protein
MPLYEYECLECGKLFDTLRSFQDADKAIVCIQCNSSHTKRLLSMFFAQSGGKAVAGSSGCNNCSGGSCSSCSNN